MGLNETELLELQERASLALDSIDDPEVQRRYAAKASEHDVPKLIEALREAYRDAGGGGDFGLMLRNALKSRIMEKPMVDEDRRIATLCDDVKLHSLNVAAIRGEGRVVVDVRLMIGDEPVLG